MGLEHVTEHNEQDKMVRLLLNCLPIKQTKAEGRLGEK